MSQQAEKVRVNLKLNRATHSRLKVWCAQRGVSIQSALERLLERRFAATVSTAAEDPK
jgi:hypothetical protein